jgi:hypothetical protein
VPRATPARAECMTLVSGPIAYDVMGCKLIEPEAVFDTHKERFSWIAGLDAAGRKKFYDSYRGLYLKGKVVKSGAVSKGVAAEQGALSGQTVFMFIPPSAMKCDNVLGKRIGANLREVCCEGGGDPPCLLDTSYLLSNVQMVGSVSSAAGDQVRQKAKKSKDYQAGETAFKGHNWKTAAKEYEKARVNGELDIAGYYHLGYAYRELDQCSDAVPQLKHVQSEAEKKAIWADEENDARAAIFLLARCYSKMNDPQATVLILNSYLLEPKKYKTELELALTHKDFGWIHTSKEYRDFKKEAEKKLGKYKG